MKQQSSYLFKSFFGIGSILICLLLLLSLFRLDPADAQQPSSPADVAMEQELDTRVRTFFTAFMRGNTAPAFEELFWQSPYGAAGASVSLSDLRTKAEETKTEFGDIYRWEKIETKRFGEDVVVVRYVLKHELHPVIWSFAFYRKPTSASSVTMAHSSSWILTELRFETTVL